MDEEQQSPVSERVAEPKNRLGAVHRRAAMLQKSWFATFGAAGVVIGCLTGVLGGAGAALGVFREYRVAQQVRLDFEGDNIEVRWNTAERRLSGNKVFAP